MRLLPEAAVGEAFPEASRFRGELYRLAVAPVGRAVLTGPAVLPRLRPGEDGLAVQRRALPGWPYSFVAVLETGATSWTQVLDVVRPGPADDITAVTAAQLRDLVERLISAGEWQPGEPDIVIVTDAGACSLMTPA